MPIYGVAITKSVSFRGVAQEFGNTYYYQTPLPALDSVLDSLIDNLVTKEKAMHGTSISFVRAKCWSAGGSKADNQMRVQKTLSGAGTQGAPPSNGDVERAFLVRFRAGNDSRGNPVYLRKWWHLDVASIGGTAISSGTLQNTAQLTSGQRDAIVALADPFKSITALPQNFDLVGPTGRDISGATVAHPYLEHHQLGEMWR